MKVSIVMRAHNEERTLRAALESILNQEGVSRNDFEIVVVDNASIDNTPRIAEQFLMDDAGELSMRIISEPVPSRGRALDAGFKAAKYQWVASLDGDSLADPKWLRSIVDHIAAHPHEVAASGRLEFRQGPLFHRFLYPTLRGFWFEYFASHGLGFLSGANFWMLRDVFEKVGGTGAFEGKYDDKYLAVLLRELIREQGGHARVGYCPQARVRTDNWILRSRTGPFKEIRWALEFPKELHETQFVPELINLLKKDMLDALHR